MSHSRASFATAASRLRLPLPSMTSSQSVLRSTSSAYFSLSARLSSRLSTSTPPSSRSGLTLSRLSHIQTTAAGGLRSFSVSCPRCTSSRRSRDFGSGFNNSYDPTLESRRGPIYKNKSNGVPPFYPRDLKTQVDDYVVGQERAKKTICSTIFNHYQAIRRRAETELEDRKARDKQQRQQAARDRELRDLRDADSLSGTTGAATATDTHRLHDSVFQRYDSEDSSPHEYTPPTAPTHHIPPPYNEPPFQTPPPPQPQASTQQSHSTLEAFLNDPVQQEDNLGLPGRVSIDKSNLLLIGPTGVGKTYILETLSKKLNVPFSISDCNTFTQAGYIGQDVEACIERLLIEANFDIKAAENGIVVLDEFDKIARRETSNGRDVSGEGVQQALLKLVEGTKVTLNVKDTRSSRAPTQLPTTYGSSVPPPPQGTTPTPGKAEQFTIDTRNILFVFCGAFVGLDKQILRRVSRPSLGFSADDKPSSAKLAAKSSGSLPAEMYAHLPHQPHTVPGTGAPSFAFSPLDLATPTDLQAFGFIPELIGRVHNICALSHLSVDDLFRVLTEPRNCLVSQYTALFETYPSQLFFTRRALYAVAERAAKSETGARGLKMEMERVLAEPIFDAPMPYVLITEACVRGTEKPGYWGKDGRLEVERRMKDEDKTQADVAAEAAEAEAAAAAAAAAMAEHDEFNQNPKAAGECGA